MGAGFTPGPWGVRKSVEQEWAIDAPNGDPNLVTERWDSLATVYGNEDEPRIGNRVGAANAHLIAAAPELYAAASFADAMEVWTESAADNEMAIVTMGSIRKLRAALAKARGE